MSGIFNLKNSSTGIFTLEKIDKSGGNHYLKDKYKKLLQNNKLNFNLYYYFDNKYFNFYIDLNELILLLNISDCSCLDKNYEYTIDNVFRFHDLDNLKLSIYYNSHFISKHIILYNDQFIKYKYKNKILYKINLQAIIENNKIIVNEMKLVANDVKEKFYLTKIYNNVFNTTNIKLDKFPDLYENNDTEILFNLLNEYKNNFNNRLEFLEEENKKLKEQIRLNHMELHYLKSQSNIKKINYNYKEIKEKNKLLNTEFKRIYKLIRK